MSKNFTNIDDAFRQAFDHWDAPFSKEEMHADWSQVSKHIPHTPQSPASGSGSGIGGGLGLGKMAAWIGGAGALITGAVLYNIYVRQPQPVAEAPQVANKAVIAESKPSVPSENSIVYKEPARPSEINPVSSEQKPSRSQEPAFHGTTPDSHSKPVSGTTHPSAGGNDILGNPVTDNNSTTAPSTVNSTISSSPVTANNNNNSDNNSLQASQISMPVSSVCVGEPVSLAYSAQSKGVALNWGDGSIARLNSQNEHVYNAPGQYHIQVSSENGLVSKWVNVEAKPQARFNYSQNAGMELDFQNLSDQAVRYLWDFGDGSQSPVTSQHSYEDTGLYKVMLVAYNNAGCTDTNKKWIHVTNLVRPQRYNIFTPNGDGMDDELVLDVPGASYYHLVIVDRAGRIMFETNDMNKHWGGSDLSGKPAPDGNYAYVLQYKLQNSDKVQTEKGFLRIAR